MAEKILIFEDETKEEGIRSTVEAKVKAYGGQSERVRRVEQAIPYLSQGDVGLVVMHHYDFSDVDELKKRFPQVKYAGYSGNIRIAKEFADNPKSMGAEFIRKFSAHYDYVLENVGGCLDDVLDKFFREPKPEGEGK